jgi:hypothetical protein
MTNQLETFRDIFADVTPWRGVAPLGFKADFLGTLTDVTFLRTRFNPLNVGTRYVEPPLPEVANTVERQPHPDATGYYGEGWFEVVNWIEAARTAREKFVMISLGAGYGPQPIGSFAALRSLNSMPCKLVAVEPLLGNVTRIRQHFQTNGLNPADHWIIQAAVSTSNEPVLFPIADSVSGSQSALSTNPPERRADFVFHLRDSGLAEAALGELIAMNRTSTGLPTIPEIGFVSAVTIADILAPFEWVDYLEADMQSMESVALMPFMSLLKLKVRRLHVGTHGSETHRKLRDRLKAGGWRIIFDYAPEAVHDTALGQFRTDDGILTAVNPAL